MDEKIKNLFATVLQVPVDEINSETTPFVIEQWDSFSHLNLIAVFEENFSINIEPEEILVMRESFGKFSFIVLQKITESNGKN